MKTENEENIELRSEEFQDVLGHVPHWILRWGIGIIAIFACVLLIGSAMFKYPDVISCGIELTSTPSSVNINAGTSGNFSRLFVAENEIVKQGECLAIIGDTAVARDMSILKEFLNRTGMEAGVVQYPELGPLNLEPILPSYNSLPGLLRSGSKAGINALVPQLLKEIEDWERRYALKSPMDGKVLFARPWIEGQGVDAGENLFCIIPVDGILLSGKSLLSAAEASKIKEGNMVNVKFDRFPEENFGMVKGIVTHISYMPLKDNGMPYYTVSIGFPSGLETTRKRELPYLPEMTGRADIITEDISLLERLFMPLKNMIDKVKDNM